MTQPNRNAPAPHLADPTLWHAHLMAFAAPAIWSGNFALIRYLCHEVGLDPIPLILLRFELVAIVVLAIWLFRPPALRCLGWRGWSIVLILAVMCGAVYQWLQAYGAQGTPSALMSMCVATAPIHAVWLGWFILRERLTRSQAAALFIALCGVTLSAAGQAGWTVADLIFPLAVAGSGLLGGLTSVLARHLRDRIGAWDLACLVLVVTAAVLLLLTSTHAIEQWRRMPLSGWAAITHIATLGQLLPIYWWFRALRRLPVMTVTLYLFVMVMLAGVWGWVLRDEQLTALDLTAMACVFVALVLNARNTRKQRTVDSVPAPQIPS